MIWRMTWSGCWWGDSEFDEVPVDCSFVEKEGLYVVEEASNGFDVVDCGARIQAGVC